MANWKVGAARDLRIVSVDRWDGAAAQARLFGDGEEIDQSRAKKGHLVHDAERPDIRASYKLPFADVVDGELVAVDAGLRAAASRLPQTDIPQSVKDRARSVLDGYFRRMEERSGAGAGIVRKTVGVSIEEGGPGGGRIVINTAAVDRDGDRVLPVGVNVGAYMKNPIVQWGHNYHEPWATIGRTTKLEATETGLTAEFELRPPANEHDPQNIVRLLWEGGWVRTASVGFRPMEWKENEFGGQDYTSWELLEWSLVPVPANQEALRLAVKGLSFERGDPLVQNQERPAEQLPTTQPNDDVDRPDMGDDDIKAGDDEGSEAQPFTPATANDDNELTPDEEEALLATIEQAISAIKDVLQSGD